MYEGRIRFLSGPQIRFNSNVKETLNFITTEHPLGLDQFV